MLPSAEVQSELKRQDLFDLGVTILIAATGGLDILTEESIQALAQEKSCCLIHSTEHSGSLSIRTLRKLLARLDPNAQDFICKCL